MTEQMWLVAENRSKVYDFLAQLFLNPIPTPGDDYIKKLSKAVDGFSEDYGLEDHKQGVHLLKNFKAAINCSDLQKMQKHLAIDRTKLCRGTPRSNNISPPYEALYLTPEKETEQLLLLVQFYQKAGLTMSDESHERLDYIGIELAFMAELCTREAASIRKGEENKYKEILLLEQKFLNEHLLKWVLDYCAQMINFAQTEFFRGIGHLLRAFLQEERETVAC
ncbi:MAG: molecular chaperone TorD family protein [Bacillota bacterium]